MRGIRWIVGAIVCLLLSSGCAAVKPWERGDLSLAPMQTGQPPAAAMEENVQTYREGGAGGTGGKAGGGCGCT